MTAITELHAFAVRVKADGRMVYTRIGGAWPLMTEPGWGINLDALPHDGVLVLTPNVNGPEQQEAEILF